MSYRPTNWHKIKPKPPRFKRIKPLIPTEYSYTDIINARNEGFRSGYKEGVEDGADAIVKSLELPMLVYRSKPNVTFREDEQIIPIFPLGYISEYELSQWAQQELCYHDLQKLKQFLEQYDERRKRESQVLGLDSLNGE